MRLESNMNSLESNRFKLGIIRTVQLFVFLHVNKYQCPYKELFCIMYIHLMIMRLEFI